MTDEEMALKIANLILEFQMRVISLEAELSLHRVEGHPMPWQDKARQSTDELLQGRPYQERIAELSVLFEKASPNSLLETLYMAIFRTSPHN
jgi:hypothetical protein